MNTNLLTASIATLAAAFAFSSCTEVRSNANIQGDYAKTAQINIDRTDCKLLCGRVSGESKGFMLLGFIPFAYPSETTALENMYENARTRGVKLEGDSVAFANTSVENRSNYYILWSIPTIKTSGDVVQYIDKVSSTDKKGKR